MREIKFRAWDTENKKMYSCDWLSFLPGGIRFTWIDPIVSDIGNIEIVWENGGLFLKGFSNNLGWQCENLDVEVIGNINENHD